MNAGEVCGDVILQNDIPRGHKFALCDMQNGDNIIKYAAPGNDLVSSTALAISGAH